MATAGPLTVDYREYGTTYRDETASPGYYAATLDRYGIRAEATATARTSGRTIHLSGGYGPYIVEPRRGAHQRRVVPRCGASAPLEIEGSKLLGTFCYNPQKVFPVYFVLRVSSTPSASGYWKKQRPMTGVEAEWTPDNGESTKPLYAVRPRALGRRRGLLVHVRRPARGRGEVEGADGHFVCQHRQRPRRNLDAEQAAGDSFDGLHAAAERRWNDDLSRIRVEGGTPEQRTVFYTALYHTLIHPNLLNDTNGEYPLMERSGETGVSADGDRYTVFSLWDTYRNVHQLLTLAYPRAAARYGAFDGRHVAGWGWFPKWGLYGRETFTMEGDPAVPLVLVDTWRKGLRDFDMEGLARRDEALGDDPRRTESPCGRHRPYIERGHIPLGYFAGDNSGDNSVSHALEYYVADARWRGSPPSGGEHEFAAELRRRAAGWKHITRKSRAPASAATPTGSSSPFDPRQGENFEPVPVSTRVRPGTIRSSCPTTSRDWHVRWVASVSSWKLHARLRRGPVRPCERTRHRLCLPFQPLPRRGVAYPARGRTAARQSTSPPRPDGMPETTTRAPCRARAVFSMLGSIPDCPGEVRTTRLTTPLFDRAEIGDSARLAHHREAATAPHPTA